MKKKTTKVMFSSENMEEVTPQDFFEQLDQEFRFELDLAADNENSKCKYYYDEETDALEQDWKGVCWCNPPYGRGIVSWVCKAADEAALRKEVTIVMLLPARTDTRWFSMVAESADEIRFIKGRLKFGDNANSAPFPSMVAIWNIGSHIRYPMIEGEPYYYNLIWRR